MTSASSLAVWAGEARSGILEGERGQKHIFAYFRDAGTEVDVSLTMPLRLESWVSRDLHPIFQMNLPEGALLEVIRRAISKVVGDDDLSILRVTGGNQVGRNRFSLPGEAFPRISETPESLQELLTYPDTRDLFHELMARYALRSGISGVQPKVLLDATERGTLTSARYIVKSWGTDYPYLAANEYFCMTAAKRAGTADAGILPLGQRRPLHHAPLRRHPRRCLHRLRRHVQPPGPRDRTEIRKQLRTGSEKHQRLCVR